MGPDGLSPSSRPRPRLRTPNFAVTVGIYDTIDIMMKESINSEINLRSERFHHLREGVELPGEVIPVPAGEVVFHLLHQFFEEVPQLFSSLLDLLQDEPVFQQHVVFGVQQNQRQQRPRQRPLEG